MGLKMITTEKTLKDFGFKYLFDYGIKPNPYEIYRRKDMGYFFIRTKTNLLEEVGHLRFCFGEFQKKYIYDTEKSKISGSDLIADVRFHKEHNDTMKDISDLEKTLHSNRCCATDYEEVTLE